MRVIPPAESTGELRRAYDTIKEQRGAIANIFQAQSLRPDTMLAHLGMYRCLMFSPGTLSRAERETIAVVVSAANSCAYCVIHHSDALSAYERNSTLVKGLAQGEIPADLPPRARAIARYARKLTRQPFAVEEGDVEALREAGLTDDEILLTNLIASYYSFVNRFVDGLGVELETDTRAYKY